MKAVRAFLVAGMVGLAGCSSTPPPATAPAPAVSSAPAFGGTDRAWIEINVAMNEELLPLLDLAPALGRDPAVKELAAEVRAFTEAELSTLRRLHAEAGLPAENPHKGMPMPGMVTPEQVTTAGQLKGAAFDTFFRQQIKAHLEQGRKLAESEEKSGMEPQTRTLATEVLRTRSDTLAEV